MSALSIVLKRIAREVWFRAALFSALAVAFALAAGAVDVLIPTSFPLNLGQGAVGTILQVIASSMLAVTTFSLTAMVTAYSAATSSATPRATQLLVQDPTSQNALSTFLGSFVFALVGIIALSTDYYSDQGRALLFFGTLAVVAVIVVTLLGWIAHLAQFGRMADVIDRVERAATETMRAYATSPTLGAVARGPRPVPAHAPAVHTEDVGFVTHVDVAALNTLAEKRSARMAIVATPGSIADATTPLVRVTSGQLEDGDAASVRRCFRVESHRTYEQDPRLGVIALSEIGSRALSPAVNDPGTAIDVLGALGRVFARTLRTPQNAEIPYPRLDVDPVSWTALVDDAFRPLARAGSEQVEVAIRLQRTLAALAATSPPRAEIFRAAADEALQRARRALSREDARTLRGVHRDCWGR